MEMTRRKWNWQRQERKLLWISSILSQHRERYGWITPCVKSYSTYMVEQNQCPLSPLTVTPCLQRNMIVKFNDSSEEHLVSSLSWVTSHFDVRRRYWFRSRCDFPIGKLLWCLNWKYLESKLQKQLLLGWHSRTAPPVDEWWMKP
jgi:hypothetical protein